MKRKTLYNSLFFMTLFGTYGFCIYRMDEKRRMAEIPFNWGEFALVTIAVIFIIGIWLAIIEATEYKDPRL